MAEYILEMKSIVKRFPGTLALNKVDFNLKEGEVMALIGENGAGKSTLMNVLMGVFPPDEGEIYLRDKKIENKSPYEALQNGIGMVPQELNLVHDIAIAENIFLGLHQKKNHLIDWNETKLKAKEILDKLNVDINPMLKVKDISPAYQQLISIARTLVFGSNIIILDEPTAALTMKEAEHLFNNIRKLKAEGKSIIIITHHLEEVVELSDRVTIMRDGQVVKACNTNELTIDDMIYYMANQRVENKAKEKRKYANEDFLEVRNLSRKNEFENISFKVKKGEILGVAGLIGAGRTELFSCIYGLAKKDKGQIFIEGKEVAIDSPQEAIAHHIGLVPEERRRLGMFPVLPIYENVMIPSYSKVKRMGIINFKQVRKTTDQHIEKLRIKTPSNLTLIKNLSGGNQQKVILARWMEKKVKLLILDEPTRGIDVRAKGEIYQLIKEMADSGITIILISSEMEELIKVADRIMVMHGGKLKGFVDVEDDLEGEDILKIALQ